MYEEDKLIIKKITLNRDRIKSFDRYPFNIDVIKQFSSLDFTSPVTFFVGENGIGKSTFIEAIAVALGLNAEGGTQNFRFSTLDTTSSLSDYLFISKQRQAKTKFFLRAESFYNFSTEVQRLVEEDEFFNLYDSYGGNLHECSHGESFLKLMKNRFTDQGLYILDEPESALSPLSQMAMIKMIDDLVKRGSQFIIASHSPILISYRGGEIFDLNHGFEKIDFEKTDIYSYYKAYLNDPLKMQQMLLDD